jgi:hypothetical protein
LGRVPIRCLLPPVGEAVADQHRLHPSGMAGIVRF